MSAERSTGAENGGNSGDNPQTLAQRLRQGIADAGKDFVGLSTRLITYAGTAIIVEIVGAASGLDRSTSISAGIAALTINMFAGELYYMRRLARALPLVRADRTGWWDNKRNS